MEQVQHSQIRQLTKKEIEYQKRKEESWLRFLSKKGKGYIQNPSPDCHLRF